MRAVIVAGMVVVVSGCNADADETGEFRNPNTLGCLDLAAYHRLTLMEFVAKHPAGVQCGGLFVSEGLMSEADFRAACDLYYASRPAGNPEDVTYGRP